MKADSDLIPLARAVSRLLGWIYFLCWSLSFYPQPYSNYKRRSTQGLAIDFSGLNLLGFTAYTISTAAFLWSPTIRDQYAKRHPVSPEPTVRLNDFAFAAHAFILCLVTYSQFFPSIWGFDVSWRQRSSRVVLGIVSGCMVGVLFVIGLVVFSHSDGDAPPRWEWIDVIYSVGYIKLICTLVKYCPQAFLNYKLKSTVGWSIMQILLDFAGGILSLLQLLLDSSLQNDWSGFFGNPVKLGLSNISLCFDVLFMTQHYILYKPSRQAYAVLNDDDGDTGGQDDDFDA